MPFLLDSDHLSILHRRQQPECGRIVARLEQYPADDIATTIISFHEVLRGWMAYLNQSRTPAQIVRAYRELEAVLRSFGSMNIVAYGPDSEQRFGELRSLGIRIGTMDLRIAAIGLGTNSVIVSRNLVDFRKVTGLKVEDWTIG